MAVAFPACHFPGFGTTTIPLVFPPAVRHVDPTTCAPDRRPAREFVTWKLPPPGWLKLNVDGSSFGNPGDAGAGGVIRDHRGHWIVGFSASIGMEASLHAELWAIKHGIQLAFDRVGVNTDGVIIESDCSTAVKMILGKSYSPLLQDIRTLLARLESVCHVLIGHVYREANHCADFLAKRGAHQTEKFHIYDDHPPELGFTLRVDRDMALFRAF